LLTLLFLGLTSCAPWNAETRKVGTSGVPNVADSAYIESHRKTGPNYGCSFIEFDGKGGFLDYGQYQHALAKLDELKARSDVVLVSYRYLVGTLYGDARGRLPDRRTVGATAGSRATESKHASGLKGV
jgi:hypothetical protein